MILLGEGERQHPHARSSGHLPDGSQGSQAPKVQVGFSFHAPCPPGVSQGQAPFTSRATPNSAMKAGHLSPRLAGLVGPMTWGILVSSLRPLIWAPTCKMQRLNYWIQSPL